MEVSAVAKEKSELVYEKLVYEKKTEQAIEKHLKQLSSETLGHQFLSIQVTLMPCRLQYQIRTIYT